MGDSHPAAVSVGEDFPRQQERVRELLATYRELDGTPGVNCFFAIRLIDEVLKRADRAAIGGDVIEILRSYEELKGCE